MKQLISEAIAPLEVQIKALRSELEALKNPASVTEPASSSNPEAVPSSQTDAVTSSEIDAPSDQPLSEIPAERTDFMRFIQRGLEQEEKEYKDEPAAKPEKKAGWNPFKR